MNLLLGKQTYWRVSKAPTQGETIMISDVHPVRPLDAVVALARLIRDPNDTVQAFRVVRALDGHHADRLFRRFAESEGGARLLAERPSILAALSDRESLRALPEGSVGRAYLAFCEREGITADGLVEASELEERDRLDPDFRYMADRLRDSHDLWHVLAGYRTDLLGENSVLAFTAAQTGSAGVALLAAAGYVRSFTLKSELSRPARALVRDAFLRGRRAAWLPALPLEELLARPLADVRRELGLGEAPSYAPLYAADLLAAA
jgi:ubiquinone biosynthesis protein COQ4